MSRWRIVVILWLGVSLSGVAFAASEESSSTAPVTAEESSSVEPEAAVESAAEADVMLESAAEVASVESEEEQVQAEPEGELQVKDKKSGYFSRLAEKFLDAAKLRILAEKEAKEEAKAERERQRQEAKVERERQRQEAREAKAERERQRQEARAREGAQQMALKMSRAKLKERTAKVREAQRQLLLAKERQLKATYKKALDYYHQGVYGEAVKLLQQMALIDPDHSLTNTATRLIEQAELKHFEQRLRMSASSPETSGAAVPELEQLLMQKRIEMETAVKYAKIAAREGKYDTALKLLTAILVQDPTNRDARQLHSRIRQVKLHKEERTLLRQVILDEQEMRNEIFKGQLLPSPYESLLQSDSGRFRASVPELLSAKLQQPISFEFDDVALSDVLEFVSSAASVSIIPSPQLDLAARRVSLKVRDMPLEQAIKYLVKSLSLSYRVEQDAVLISTEEEFENEPLETRVFMLQAGIGPMALETSAVASNPALAMESVTGLIEQSVPQPPESKFILDERSGALIVTNTTENIRLVERLLNELDVVPLQVLIEARFVELTLTDLDHVGFESVLTGNVGLSKTVDTDDTRGIAHQVTSGGGFKFPALARESEGLNLTLEGVLTGTQFESVLHLLEESKKSKTLSAPRVTTLNNQTAMIRVVDEFNYPTRYEVSLIQFDINGDGDFDDANETEFANVPQDLQTRDIGILLSVTPSVGRDMKTITLVLAPEVSSFSQFRDLGGGVTVPEFTNSYLTTSVVIEDGQTVVLGGLMKDTTTTTVTKVPVLGDLPLVGALFRQKDESSTRKNLLIFITARILFSGGEIVGELI